VPHGDAQRLGQLLGCEANDHLATYLPDILQLMGNDSLPLSHANRVVIKGSLNRCNDLRIMGRGSRPINPR
jgi:hypothetical protein